MLVAGSALSMLFIPALVFCLHVLHSWYCSLIPSYLFPPLLVSLFLSCLISSSLCLISPVWPWLCYDWFVYPVSCMYFGQLFVVSVFWLSGFALHSFLVYWMCILHYNILHLSLIFSTAVHTYLVTPVPDITPRPVLTRTDWTGEAIVVLLFVTRFILRRLYTWWQRKKNTAIRYWSEPVTSYLNAFVLLVP